MKRSQKEPAKRRERERKEKEREDHVYEETKRRSAHISECFLSVPYESEIETERERERAS